MIATKICDWRADLPQRSRALSSSESGVASDMRRRGDPLVRVAIVAEFARMSTLRRGCAGIPLRSLLALLVFMAYGCACIPEGHFHSEYRIDHVAASSSHSMVAFGHAGYTNSRHRCHDDPPEGSTSGGHVAVALSSQQAPVTPPLPLTGLASAGGSGRERSPPGGPPRGSYPEVCRTSATVLAMLCVFRS